MAKPKNIETQTPIVIYKADPETFRSIVLKVHETLKDDSPFVSAFPRSAGENDAMIMSQEVPNEPFITVYQNGIPVTMSVTELIQDVVISVFMKAATKEN